MTDHQLLRDALRDFLKKEAMPHINRWEQAGEINREIWQKLGSMGFLGLCVPEQFGGAGQDIQSMMVLAEELTLTRSGGFAAAVLAHVGLAMVYIERFASQDIKQRYLPQSCTGAWVGCLAVTEPSTGSDVASISTKAVRNGDHYIISGAKTFITNGVYSDYLVVAAKTTPDAGSAGISLFVVDRATEGVSARKLDKLGWRASDTGEISLDDVVVPAANLVGDENMGFYYIMQNFALERLLIAVAAIAACQDALDCTLQYMSERKAFGRSIDKFQVLRHRIAQLSSEVERSRIFNQAVLQAYLRGDYPVKECAMAKLLSTELSDKVMYECLQCFGGYGFMEDYPLARMFRDSRLGTIGGGTSEIMRDLIAKLIVDC